MVSNSTNNNDSIEHKPTSDLPEGRYRLISWDIDTTGRRLIDEICQIAAYTPIAKFSQHIMPYADLNLAAQKRHNIRVVTITRYRMLKDLRTNKFIKTKSEISALTDFLNWLEENRADSDGIILVFHEIRKLAPIMLIEALRRYNLQDRFAAVVKGFANSFNIAEHKCAKTVKSFSLKVLSRVLLDKEGDLDNAAERARLCYHIVQHLGQGERLDLDGEGSGDSASTEHYAIELVKQYARTISFEEKELADMKKLIERQNTFRPVFKELLNSPNWVNRQYANKLRRRLVENNLDFAQVKNAWESGGKKSIEEILQKICASDQKEYNELLEILDCFFDPQKKPVQPKPWPNRNFKRSTDKKHSSSEASADTATPRSDSQQ